ncbi:MAG: SDR family oxidoreductase [Actinomycetota bacterium]|nr:SDR family oxidoreductase [Actinomycetota bacterium]
MADTGRVLVTGATGNIGSAVLDILGTMDLSPRALVHDESKARTMTDKGVKAFVGDFLKPDGLAPTLEGVGTILLITPHHPKQVAQATNIIEAARDSGNDPRIVRLLVAQASHEAPTKNCRQHAQIEEELISSGLPYTLLRPTTFMQNTLATTRTVASEGRIDQPFKDGKLGMIDARDIGEAATKVLTEDGHEGKTYTLTGPEAISFHDIAEILSEVLGKKVDYVPITLEKAKEAMLGMGLSEWKAEVLIEYATAHSQGYSNFTTEDVEQLTGHTATSYREFASDFERAFGGA